MPDLDLLVVGDANPDLIVRGGDLVPAFGQREQIVDEAALVLGGSGSIMACGAAKLGLRVAMAACVGDDALGRFTLEALADGGVDTGAVQVLAGVPTGLSVALAREDDRAILTARGALEALDPAQVPDELLARARHVHIASPFLQPRLRTGLTELVERAHASGATVSLDTGWDPEERWAIAVSQLDVLLPNAEEAIRLANAEGAERASVAASGNTLAGGRRPEAVSGRGADARPAGTALAALGPVVAVKLGAAGAMGFSGDSVVRVAVPTVAAVDSTGAGDSFDAGFLAAWLDGAGLADALALGCACGALSTRALGGTAGQPSRAEAEVAVAS
jgi:sugar/nucleoside kinase (ribokinase family)